MFLISCSLTPPHALTRSCEHLVSDRLLHTFVMHQGAVGPNALYTLKCRKNVVLVVIEGIEFMVAKCHKKCKENVIAQLEISVVVLIWQPSLFFPFGNRH